MLTLLNHVATRLSAILILVAIPMIAVAEATADRPVKVFILAGQSNMEGKAKIALLEYQLTQPETRTEFAHLQRNGQWVERDDVWIRFLDRHGKLTVGYGSPGCIGPELQFGNTVGDHFDQQVLIIKTAWGGKSLFRDFRPPSSGLPSAEVLQRHLEQMQRNRPDAQLNDVKESFGAYYRLMLSQIEETLADLPHYFPGYEGQGYEIAGFVWFQGWNDMINAEYTAEYTQHMVHFIRDVRRDLDAPELPIVIGQLGVGGVEENPEPRKQQFKHAQAAAADASGFAGNVKVVPTDVFWDEAADAVFKKGWREHLDEWNRVGSDWPFHYLGSVQTYSRIGTAFGEAMIELIHARSSP